MDSGNSDPRATQSAVFPVPAPAIFPLKYEFHLLDAKRLVPMLLIEKPCWNFREGCFPSLGGQRGSWVGSAPTAPFCAVTAGHWRSGGFHFNCPRPGRRRRPRMDRPRQCPAWPSLYDLHVRASPPAICPCRSKSRPELQRADRPLSNGGECNEKATVVAVGRHVAA